MATEGTIAALIDALYGVSIVTRVEVAAAAVFLWDWAITLGMEAELIWPSRWNSIKVLYLIQRYLPMVDTCILTLYRDLASRTDHQCFLLQKATGFSFLTGIVISEILMTFRVYAVWGQSRFMLWSLILAFLLVWIPAYVFMYYFANSMQFTSDLPIPGFTGCFVSHASNYVIGCWASLMVWNTLMTGLMLIPGWKIYSSGRTSAYSNLARIVYRDGTFYFIYLFVLSATNIILSLVATPTRKFMLTALERCVHTMLASRVILHMRESAKQPALEWVGGEYSAGPVEFLTTNSSMGPNMELHSQRVPKFDSPNRRPGTSSSRRL